MSSADISNTNFSPTAGGTRSAVAADFSKTRSFSENSSTVAASRSYTCSSSDDIRRPTSDFPDERLAQLWDEMDWREAEEILAILQKKLSYAAKHQDADEVFRTQKKIVRNPDIKCLAVRHVCGTKASPAWTA